MKSLKRYCKAASNVFFNKSKFDDDNLFYLYGRSFVSNQNFYT